MNICQILCGIIFWYIKFFTFNPNAQKAENNLRRSIVPCILHLMVGQVPLLHHTLGLWLFGIQIIQYTVQY
jgi:hypothetical protein